MKQPFNQFTTFLFFLFLTIGTGPAIADDPVQFEGLIEPFEMVDVGSPVEGLVAHVNVQRSSSVKKGEPLVLLESSVENAIVERARVLATVEGELRRLEHRTDDEQDRDGMDRGRQAVRAFEGVRLREDHREVEASEGEVDQDHRRNEADVTQATRDELLSRSQARGSTIAVEKE